MEDLREVMVFCLVYSGVIIYTLAMTVRPPAVEDNKVKVRIK